jgi:hypothetical protein
MAKQEVSFDVTATEARTIRKIVIRYRALLDKHTGMAPFRDRQSMVMDLTAVHANGNPMRLEALLAADDFNLLHDMTGIERHLDRRTGKLTGFFSPRFSAPVEEAA